MSNSPIAPPGATLEDGHPGRVSADVVGSFRMGDGPRTAVVEVEVRDLLTLTLLVGPERVVPPVVRGDVAVRFLDRSLARDVYGASQAAYAQSFGEAPR